MSPACCDRDAKNGEQNCELHLHLSWPWLSGEVATQRPLGMGTVKAENKRPEGLQSFRVPVAVHCPSEDGGCMEQLEIGSGDWKPGRSLHKGDK